jgi:dynein heavy chain
MAALKEGQEKLDAGQKILDALNADLKDCEEKVARLQAEAAECKATKEATETELALNEKRLVRAGKLLGGLADEKERWEDLVKKFI